MGLYDDVYKRFAKDFNVYDGDSIRCDLDEGDYRWELNRPLRLFGVDTPELAPQWKHYEDDEGNRDEEGRTQEKVAAMEARDRCKALIGAATSVVVVQTIKLPGRAVRDKYGRTLAKILIPIGETLLDLSACLLAEKHARPYDGGRKTKWVLLRELGQADLDPSEVVATVGT